MGRKNSLSTNKELKKLVEKYEAAKTENRQIYLDGDQLSEIAGFYASQRQFDDAEEVIEYGLQLHPLNTDLLIEQSYLYLDTQRILEAKEVANSITENYETDVKILKAELLLCEGKLEEAQALLSTVEEWNELDVIIDIVYLYLDLGYPEAAKEWLDKGKSSYSEEEDYIAITADYLANTNQQEEAIAYYDKLIDIDSYNSTYWMGIAKCYFTQVKIDKALEACDFALAANEQCGEAYAYRAHCFFYLNNCEEAIENYEKAIEYKSIPPEMAYMFMGVAYSTKEDWEKATKYYDEVIRTFQEAGDPDSILLVDTYNSKGYAAGRMGKYEEAHQFCDKAATLDPDEILSPLTHGRIYLMQGMIDKAEEIFQKITNENPPIDIWYLVANSYADVDLLDGAKLYYEKVYEMNPQYEDVAERLCIISLIQQNIKDFFKYNNDCKNPMDEDAIMRILSSEYREEDEATFKHILELMKKNK